MNASALPIDASRFVLRVRDGQGHSSDMPFIREDLAERTGNFLEQTVPGVKCLVVDKGPALPGLREQGV